MDELVVRTEVYADRADVFELLCEFPRYSDYSEYLRSVRTISGDGGAGTRYGLTFAWWKLEYTAHSEVTDVVAPERIEWRITKDIDAHGSWTVTPIEPASEAADGTDADTDVDPDADVGSDPDADSEACEVQFRVRFDPSSASPTALDLPRLVSFDWVLKKAIPLIRTEAEHVIERAVADLEGRERQVDLDVYVDSDRI